MWLCFPCYILSLGPKFWSHSLVLSHVLFLPHRRASVLRNEKNPAVAFHFVLYLFMRTVLIVSYLIKTGGYWTHVFQVSNKGGWWASFGNWFTTQIVNDSLSRGIFCSTVMVVILSSPHVAFVFLLTCRCAGLCSGFSVLPNRKTNLVLIRNRVVLLRVVFDAIIHTHAIYNI